MFGILNIKNKSNSTNTLLNLYCKDHENIGTVEPVEAETFVTTSETINDFRDLNSTPAQSKFKVGT